MAFRGAMRLSVMCGKWSEVGEKSGNFETETSCNLAYYGQWFSLVSSSTYDHRKPTPVPARMCL